jgi:hypothetical protein
MKRLKTQLVAAVVSDKPKVPEAGRLLWRLFIELSSGRSGNGFGPNPLSWVEIEAWKRVRRWPLSDDHIDILLAMDRAWIEAAYKKKPDAPDGMKTAHPIGGKFSLAAFDVMFS